MPINIDLLVYGLYNATILAEDFGKKYSIENEMVKTTKTLNLQELLNKKTGERVEIGDELQFNVDR